MERLKTIPRTLLLLALAGLAGCGQATSPPPPTSYAGTEDTTLGPGDVLEVKVYNEKNLSGKHRVSTKGDINFPLVGVIKVQGMNPPDVAAELTKRLAKDYLKSPHVIVFVKSYQSKKISVYGSVRRPGTFTYSNNMSIIEAVTKAGGFTPLARKNKTTVTRFEKGKKLRYTLPVEDIGEGKASNYLLQPGDVVYVPERYF